MDGGGEGGSHRGDEGGRNTESAAVRFAERLNRVPGGTLECLLGGDCRVMNNTNVVRNFVFAPHQENKG